MVYGVDIVELSGVHVLMVYGVDIVELSRLLSPSSEISEDGG